MDSTTRRLAAIVDRLPPFPHSVRRILDMSHSANTSPKDLVQVIHHDPVMTAKMLKMVNSAYFGLSRQINSVNRAVVHIGFNTIKNLALTIAAMGALPRINTSTLKTTPFLLHSLGVATVARKLSQLKGIDPSDTTDFFVAGLLHDFGRPVLARFKREEFELAVAEAKRNELPLYQTENELIGLDHTHAGALLGEHWQLPAPLVDCLRLHHSIPENGLTPILACVVAADVVITGRHFGDSGNTVTKPLPDAVAEYFNTDIEGLNHQLGDMADDLEHIRTLSSV